MWRNILIGVLSAFVAGPKNVRRSSRSRDAFLQCLAFVCTNPRLATKELRPWACRTKNELQRSIISQLQGGSRCCEYSIGPCGWSGDASKPRKFFANFVGVRSDLLQRPGRCFPQFTIRHELQHEIQRQRDGVDDATTEARRMSFGVEKDANQAALLFVIERRKLRRWQTFWWPWYLWLTARWCGATKLAKVVTILFFLTFDFSAFLIIPNAARYIAPSAVCLFFIDQLSKEIL